MRDLEELNQAKDEDEMKWNGTALFVRAEQDTATLVSSYRENWTRAQGFRWIFTVTFSTIDAGLG